MTEPIFFLAGVAFGAASMFVLLLWALDRSERTERHG